ncbi:NAD-dependent deacetylase [Actinobacteria bacterium YIM 96077]|uniref:protein acetyllysine N-acetyltransferase n=1 Tax=Phytoactinopolyspora halophila TaxID=1981511 RepID=A0A329QF36_9ACTN|nr:Sir2 family NAD-dependent protein deacetylase [Phytoactinopolyspora halophila]AYY14070.1 NAD-dependent deacetylase [Actinobacteria bacterium YIM 96077]RAW10977.1 NAD-dependent deacetylase [Phytoactinopolyspora halophila]
MEEATTRAVGRWLASADTVTVLTGAGISTESGIPDFRGPQGLWTKDPAAQAMFTIDNYLADPEVRRRAWQERLHHPAWSAEPNAGHHALVDLERSGRLRAIVTQNIDGLHQAAGSSPENVIEIHGTVHWVACLSCGLRTPMPEVLERVRAGDEDPACRECGGIQKSATISFGQMLDPEVLAAATEASRDCDVFLALGTSLSVYPAAGLCDYALAAGARLIVINAQPTPYDGRADAVLREPISELLPQLVGPAG